MCIRSPTRVTHTYRQHLDGRPAIVFPLLCPVREVDWVPGWAPIDVLSASGVAERDCVFTTPDATPDGPRESTWTITEHDPAAGHVEMLKVTPGFLVTRLVLTVRPHGAAGSTADVTHTYTALGQAGEAFVRARTTEAYAAFMREWEDAMNTYLRSGARPSTP
jgi:hypothetical protein